MYPGEIRLVFTFFGSFFNFSEVQINQVLED